MSLGFFCHGIAEYRRPWAQTYVCFLDVGNLFLLKLGLKQQQLQNVYPNFLKNLKVRV